MPRFTYVTILNINTMERVIKAFVKMSEAISFVKSFRCKGHVVYAERYDEILAFKSDSVGFQMSRS